jgi:hypothetical protein
VWLALPAVDDMSVGHELPDRCPNRLLRVGTHRLAFDEPMMIR